MSFQFNQLTMQIDLHNMSKISIKTAWLIFTTFVINCIVVGLLIASWTMDDWIEAEKTSHNLHNEKVYVHFGLLSSSNSTNIWRWLGSFLSTGSGIFSGSIGALIALLNSCKKHETMIMLFISNGISGS